MSAKINSCIVLNGCRKVKRTLFCNTWKLWCSVSIKFYWNTACPRVTYCLYPLTRLQGRVDAAPETIHRANKSHFFEYLPFLQKRIAEPCPTVLSRSQEETQKLKKQSIINCPRLWHQTCFPANPSSGVPQTFSLFCLVKEGFPLWESVLCNTHATRGRAPAMGVVFLISHFS